MQRCPTPRLRTFLADLRTREGIAARALEFTILNAARTGEVIGARWTETNLKLKVWTVPAERMKGGREHRVPLTDAAIAVLEANAKGSAERLCIPWGPPRNDEQHGNGHAAASDGP